MLEGILILLFGAAAFYGIFKLTMRTHNLLKQGEKDIQNQMASNNFTVTRKVDRKTKLGGMAHVHLYVDDNTKRWLLTSPYFPQIGKIRSFSDLEDYAFFDEEGADMTGKLVRACLGTAVGIGAVGIGLAGGQAAGTIGGKFVGITTGIASGYFANKALKAPMGFMGGLGFNGASKAFGIMLKTKECTEENPALVFDFITIKRDGFKYRQGGSSAVAGLLELNNKLTGQPRDMTYKDNVKAIEQMFEIFEEIIQSK